MIKTVLYSVLYLFMIIPPAVSGTSPAASFDEEELTFIRNGFYEAIESRSMTNKMLDYVESNFTEEYLYGEPVLLAYYGTLHALKAKHVFNPFSKISYLRAALRILDKAAIDGACNLEVRFLRFSVLHNIPGFLGLRENLQKDTDAVFELLVVDGKYTELEKSMAFDVIEFVIDSRRLNQDQQKEMELLVKRLKSDEQLSSD